MTNPCRSSWPACVRSMRARYAGKFVELWQNADAQLQPRVEAKRDAAGPR